MDTTELSQVENYDMEVSVAYALSNHWSLGFFGELGSNSYDNITWKITAHPAIEYNIFPYSESTEHQLRLEYAVIPTYRRYIDETVYLKTEEYLLNHALALRTEGIYHWGSVDAGARAHFYQQDVSKRRLGIYGHLSLRIFRGLSLDLRGDYWQVRDQLHLPADNADIADIITQRQDIATSFEYRFHLGINYTFGSIYRSTVNARFGSF